MKKELANGGYERFSKIIDENAEENKWTLDDMKNQLGEYLDRVGVDDKDKEDILSRFITGVKGKATENMPDFTTRSRAEMVYGKIWMRNIVNNAITKGTTTSNVVQTFQGVQTSAQQQGNGTTQDTENKQSSTDDDTDGITN